MGVLATTYQAFGVNFRSISDLQYNIINLTGLFFKQRREYFVFHRRYQPVHQTRKGTLCFSYLHVSVLKYMRLALLDL